MTFSTIGVNRTIKQSASHGLGFVATNVHVNCTLEHRVNSKIIFTSTMLIYGATIGIS